MKANGYWNEKVQVLHLTVAWISKNLLSAHFKYYRNPLFCLILLPRIIRLSENSWHIFAMKKYVMTFLTTQYVNPTYCWTPFLAYLTVWDLVFWIRIWCVSVKRTTPHVHRTTELSVSLLNILKSQCLLFSLWVLQEEEHSLVSALTIDNCEAFILLRKY